MRRFLLLKQFFWYLLPTIYFNFHYLPFRQAIKLPILLYKPHFISLKGKIIIDALSIRIGMIRMGHLVNTCNPNNGISIDNRGGTIGQMPQDPFVAGKIFEIEIGRASCRERV